MADATLPERNRWRVRFSLLSALLLMTIVGMAIAVVQLWREVAPLRAEVGRLRQELGYLTIVDENKIYAIQVPSDDSNAKRYRVYLPRNRTFKLHARIRTIPGRPPQVNRQQWLARLLESRSGTTGEIEGGEHTIEVRLQRNPEKPDYWDFRNGQFGRGWGGVGAEMPFLNDPRAWSVSGEAPINHQIEMNPDDGIVLYTLRKGIVTETNGGYSMSSPDPAKDAEGVMLWIAPADAGK